MLAAARPAFHAHDIGGGGVMFSERVGSLMERENLLTAPSRC